MPSHLQQKKWWDDRCKRQLHQQQQQYAQLAPSQVATISTCMGVGALIQLFLVVTITITARRCYIAQVQVLQQRVYAIHVRRLRHSCLMACCVRCIRRLVRLHRLRHVCVGGVWLLWSCCLRMICSRCDRLACTWKIMLSC